MSPIVDGKHVLEKDGYFRNEQGLKEMTLLLSFVAMSLGVSLVINGMVGAWFGMEFYPMMINNGSMIIGGSLGLQGGERYFETKNGIQ